MDEAREVSMRPGRLWKSTYKLQIKKFVPYVPSITNPRSILCVIITQSRIKHTSRPIPIIKSNTRWIGVPISPLAWHPHFFSLASRSAANVELKKSGRMPIAGFTRCDAIPWKKRMRNPGGKAASEMARRACGRDLVKIVKLRRGPGMVVKSVVAWECFECLMQDTRCGKC
jgi:hypothetical protein